MVVSRDVAAVIIIRQTSQDSGDPEEFCGTGFLIAPGLLVTCWHCVAKAPGTGLQYAAVFSSPDGPGFKAILLSNIARDARGTDLATANLNWRPHIPLRLANAASAAGAEVISIGHAMTQTIRTPERELRLELSPMMLRGYITRHLFFDQPSFGRTSSYELDMPAPPGLSGAPIIVNGTTDVVGVVYGTNDFARVVESASVDDKGVRQPELMRIVSFGLAHFITSLQDLSGPATRGKPLHEYVKSVDFLMG